MLFIGLNPFLFFSKFKKKENENSLKKLRNLIDSYSALYSSDEDSRSHSFNSSGGGASHDLIFYIRETGN